MAKGSWHTETPSFLCLILFQPFPIYGFCQDCPIFLCKVVIPIIMGFSDDVGSLPFWDEFGGSWEFPPYVLCYPRYQLPLSESPWAYCLCICFSHSLLVSLASPFGKFSFFLYPFQICQSPFIVCVLVFLLAFFKYYSWCRNN